MNGSLRQEVPHIVIRMGNSARGHITCSCHIVPLDNWIIAPGWTLELDGQAVIKTEILLKDDKINCQVTTSLHTPENAKWPTSDTESSIRRAPTIASVEQID